MTIINEGWKDGPTSKRELKAPAKKRKDSIQHTAYWLAYIGLVIAWELALAIGAFLRGIFLRRKPKSLRGKVCLVTGAGRGLGRQFCLDLAKEGAVIACADINEGNNKKTAELLKLLGAKVVPYTVNIAVKKDVEELASKVEKELGPIYLLINNAGLVGATLKIDEEYTRAFFNINVLGPIWMMNAVLPSMELRNEGHIVNITSMTPKFVIPLLSIYGATKTSLSYYSRCVRADMLLRNKKIKVTEVYPPIINTSEDYLRMATLKLNVVVEAEEVVKATLDAIHYNYEDVIIPSIMRYPLLILTEMLPSRISTRIMQVTSGNWNVPNEEQMKNLPWHDLVKECSFTGTST